MKHQKMGMGIKTKTIIRETHIKNMYWKPHILTG